MGNLCWSCHVSSLFQCFLQYQLMIDQCRFWQRYWSHYYINQSHRQRRAGRSSRGYSLLIPFPLTRLRRGYVRRSIGCAAIPPHSTPR